MADQKSWACLHFFNQIMFIIPENPFTGVVGDTYNTDILHNHIIPENQCYSVQVL